MTKQDAINAKAIELKAEGKDENEIRRILFNMKGVRVSQILKAIEAAR